MAVRAVGLHIGGGVTGNFVGTARPHLCWQLDGPPNLVQRSYELQASSDPGFNGNVISSGLVASQSPLDAPLPGLPLASREVRWVRVRITTNLTESGWSEPLRLEAALLNQADWSARPITPPSNLDDPARRPPPIMRKTFVLDGDIATARLYVTALGLHEIWLNGTPVGVDHFQPGWTSYQQRLLYTAHDVGALLRPGQNVLSAVIADGWWRGNLTWLTRRALYGHETALLAQLEIVDAAVIRQIIVTDESWRGSTGAVASADLYEGTRIDFRGEPSGWRTPGFDDNGWEAVVPLPLPNGLELVTAPGVHEVETRPMTIVRQDNDRILLDTGQNLAGYVRLSAKGKAGSTLSVRHAEILNDAGELHTEPLRSAVAIDSYTLADDGEYVLEPPFTFHGFRYAEVTYPPSTTLGDCTAVALSSDLHATGSFECSNAALNSLYSNVRWSQCANFLSLPTDCPQRDERLGWTGDIQVFAQTACENSDVQAFMWSWLRDLALEQREDGCVSSVAPNILQGHEYEFGLAGWGDAAALVPWSLYQAYGELAPLRRQFPNMRRWVDWCVSRTTDGIWVGDLQIGDWLDPNAPPDRPDQALTDGDFIATAYLSHSASAVGRAARALGENEAAACYIKLGNDVAAACWARWADHAFTTQTGSAMALEFGIAPAHDRARVAESLAALVDAGGARIGTGFLGTPLVLPALSANGHIETAYRLLLNRECPGWLYQIDRGATTMWERWDAIQPDGSIHSGQMSTAGGFPMLSLNHFAYGAVATWLYRTVAGIAPAAPGYADTLFAPRPGGGIDWAEAGVGTPYGRSAISWRLDGDVMMVDLTIAAGTTASLSAPPDYVPSESKFGSGQHRVTLRRR